jgi:hypothetical protein
MIRTLFSIAAAALMTVSAFAGTVVVMDAPAPVAQVA